ncbi:MAG TPA: hypothetical protein V6D33_12520 [Cyanophyceae cyanobacterium]
MPIGLSLDFKGLLDAQQAVKDMRDRAEDFSPIARQLADVVRKDHLDPMFRSEPSTLSGGVVWGGEFHAPLTHRTLTLHPRRRLGQVHIDTGSLWKGTITEGGSNTYDVEGTEFTYELTDDRVPKLEQWRAILYWHDYLLEQMMLVILAFLIAGWDGK